MTAFVNPFSRFPEMQAQEDAMEVNSDLRNAMAMEEDNLDIDLELGDGPNPDLDEDSMMDDDGTDGQPQIDADQQMDDDFQQIKDQDDEVLDYAEELAPATELPMTGADFSSKPTEQPSLFSNLLSSSVPTEPLATTLPQAPQELQPPIIQVDPPPTLNPTGELSILETPKEANEGYEELESIRTLYETTEGPHEIQQSTDTKIENLTSDDNGQENQNVSAQDILSTNNIGSEDQALEQAEASKETEAVGTTEKPSVKVASGNDQPENDTVETSGPNPGDPEENTDHKPGVDHDGEVPLDAVSNNGAAARDDDGPSIDPIGILVTCQGQQMSLFPPYQEHGTPETYLLPDDKLAGSPVRALLEACRGILSDSISEHEELELSIPALKLVFKEHVPEAEHYSIRDLSDLHFQLHQNDGVEHPEPLHVVLQLKTRLAGHIDYLYTLAAEGKGLQVLAINSNNGLVENENSNHAHKTESRSNPEGEVKHDAEAELEEEEDEFGEPDLPHTELEFEDFEEPEDHTVTDQQNKAGPFDETGNTEAPASFVETTTDVGGENEGSFELNEETKAQTQNQEENDWHHDEEKPGEETLALEEHTAFDDVVTDEFYGQAVDFTDATNNVSLEANDSRPWPDQSEVEPLQNVDSASNPKKSEQPISSEAKEPTDEHGSSNAASGAGNLNGSDASSSTVQDPFAPQEEDEGSADHDANADDLFEDEYDEEAQNDDEDEAENLDLGFDDFEPNTPQSLKRSRPAAVEADDDAENADGRQLKRTRSG